MRAPSHARSHPTATHTLAGPVCQEHPTTACTVTDAEAVSACVSLLDDHRVLVEPACGAALALLYSERRRGALAHFKGKTVVVIVCGGGGVNAEILDQWKRHVLG